MSAKTDERMKRHERPDSDLQSGGVKPPAANEAECRWNAEHGQHAEEEAEGADRIARGECDGFSLKFARGFWSGEADEEQRFGQRVCGRCDQRTLRSDDTHRCGAEKQEAHVFGSR